VNIGPWRIESSIDRGGSGTVWRARHELNGSAAAIKILHGHDAVSEAHAIPFLVREVAAASRVFHPNIVNLLDFGIVERGDDPSESALIHPGSPYMAFQYESGGSLHELRGKMPWTTLRSTIFAVLEGMAHIHARGLLHLDIKPANLLFKNEERQPSGIRIADFGIAMLQPFTMMFEEKKWDLYHSNDIHGSAAYMAPEQFALNFIDFSPATDLYALAVSVWEMVCGRVPLTNWTLPDRIEFKRRHSLPPLENIVSVPHGLERWLQRLTSPMVSERYQTAADAAHGLVDIAAPIVVPSLASSFSSGSMTSTTAAPQAAVLSRRGRKQKASTPVATLTGVDFARQPTELRGHRRRFVSYETVVRPPAATPPAIAGGPNANSDAVWRAERVVRLGPTLPVRSDDEREHLWQVLRRVHSLASSEAVLIEHTPDARGQALCRWLVESSEEGGHARGVRLRYRNDFRPAQGLSFVVAELFGAVGFPAQVLTEIVRDQLKVLGVERTAELDQFLQWALSAAGAEEFDRQGDVRALARFARPFAQILGAMAAHRPVVLWIDNLQELEQGLELIAAIVSLPRGGSPVLAALSMSEGITAPAELMLQPSMTVLQRPMHGGASTAARRTLGDMSIDASALASACLRSGDIAAAETLLDRLTRPAKWFDSDTSNNPPIAPWQVMELRADIADARGELADAADGYADAAAVLFETGASAAFDPVRCGDVALKYARALRRTGQPKRGFIYAARARALFDSAMAVGRAAAAEFESGQLHFELRRWELAHSRYVDAAELAETSHDFGLLALARLGIARCRLLRTDYADASGLHDLLLHPGAASPSCLNRTWLAIVRHLARTPIDADELHRLSVTHVAPLYENLSLAAALETISLDLAASQDRSPAQLCDGISDLAHELQRTGIARFMIAEDLVLLSQTHTDPAFSRARLAAMSLASTIYRKVGLNFIADALHMSAGQ
jgi:serine/threonine protein kinase/tetratricopeptide (TPR) repeat protein